MFRLIILIILAAYSPSCAQKLRKYYLAAVDVEWDYAPTKTNVITNETVKENSTEGDDLINAPNRIGSKYGKAVFKGFTNDKFTEEIPKSEWQGFLGPIIYGEVGDTIKVYFKNLASRPYSVHTHGMLYDKSSEGAKYEDKTSAKDRLDDSVAPGASYTYTWRIDEISGPADGDPNCIPWPYHTHIQTPRGTNTGLVGASIICKKGTLDDNGRRTDVDKEFVLLVSVTDENLSYLIDENIVKYCSDYQNVDPEDEDFYESNKMHNINGYVYGNLPGLDMCRGDRVAWHVFSMGTETDMHTLYFHGNVLTIRGHRRDSFSTTPGLFRTGEMVAWNPGTWLMTSEVNTHFGAGAQALYTVDDSCGKNMEIQEPVKTRTYFIQAEESLWNYAPTGKDGFNGMRLTDPESPGNPFFENSTRIGGTYMKARYIGYEDDTFSTPLPRGADEEHLGFLGPVIRAEVGDAITVVFRNSANRSYSILSHGVRYDKANEGSSYNDRTSGLDKEDDAVAPNGRYTYNWMVPNHVGPADQDEDCLTWLYYSAVDVERDVNSGLIGHILICRSGTLDNTGKRNDSVTEFHMLLMSMDENLSWYIDDNIRQFTTLNPDDPEATDGGFVESNVMEAINGYCFANLPGLDGICPDSDIIWHLSTLGSDTDEHTVYFRGHTVVANGLRVDTVTLTPGNSVTARMLSRNPGVWRIECMTGSHFDNGMKALYTVTSSCDDKTDNTPTYSVRTIYMAATEIEWDFSPGNIDYIKNESLLIEDSSGNVFVKREGPFIGSKYRKAVFRQYTDATFTKQVPRHPHFGILGPMIRAEVGDQIRVVFKNMATREYSIHPHGLKYNNTLEDILQRVVVQPNETDTYKWDVPVESGPSERDRDCVLYAYYSDADRVRDTHSGLIGPLVICKTGTLGADGLRMDVDQEFVLLFNVFDENLSWYLDDNIRDYAPEPDLGFKEDEEFQESNLMHGINGFLFGNLKYLEMYVGETVEWYLMSVGEEVDMHTVHFHGQPVISQHFNKHRVDVIELFPGVYSTVQMAVKEPGNWLVHCHVNDHLLGGMVATYEVKKSKLDTTTPASHVTRISFNPLVIIANILILLCVATY